MKDNNPQKKRKIWGKTWVLIVGGLVITISIPILITLLYWIGDFTIIQTSIPAGNLLTYVGTIVSAAIAFFAIKRTIKMNSHKSHYDKVYFGVCDMAAKIMTNIGLASMFSQAYKINGSLIDINEKAEKLRLLLYDAIEKLNELNKEQWYYHTMLDNLGFLIHQENKDVQVVEAYFKYVYYLMNTDKGDGINSCLVSRFLYALKSARSEDIIENKVDIYMNFVDELENEYHGTEEEAEAHKDKIIYNQYRIHRETQKMTKSLMELLDLQIME